MRSINCFAIVLCVAWVALVMQACTKNDPGPRELLLTVNIEPGYFSSGIDGWIFVSDNSGNVIDVRQATDSTQVRFSGTHRGIVTVNVLHHFHDGAWNSFTVNTYQGISTGSTLQFKKPASVISPPPDSLGTTAFTLQNYNDSNIPSQALIFTDGIVSPYSLVNIGSFTYSGGTFSTDLHLSANPSKILITTYRNDVPVYLWVNDVKPGVPVTTDFDSFLPSKTIPVNKQIYHGQVNSMNGSSFASSYIMSLLYTRQMSISSNLTALPKLGYLDGFDKYFTYVALNSFDSPDNVNYEKAGSVPSSISLPDYTYSIDNPTLYGLSVKFSNDYTYKNASVLVSNSTTQVMFNLTAPPTENFKAPQIPDVIKKAYPMISTDGMKLYYAGHVKFLDGYTYGEYLRDVFANTPRDVYEQLRYQVMPPK